MPDPELVRRLFDAIQSDPGRSQRLLAARLGTSLGRVNKLVRYLVAQRWVTRHPQARAACRYVLTDDGIAAYEGLAREHLASALEQYGSVRDRVRSRLQAHTNDLRDPYAGGMASVVVYGLGDVAQIAFACAADLGVQLIGFADDSPRRSFLGLPVRAPDDLTAMAFDGQAFDKLFVASLVNHDTIRDRLERAGFPLEKVGWL
jgi:DNA-binding MarR family transcriptional regulator